MNKNSKILVLGGTGLVGSSLVRYLILNEYTDVLSPNRDKLDLFSYNKTLEYFYSTQPEYVFLAAAKVGGIKANKDNPIDFLSDNLRIQNNVIKASHKLNVKKLLFLGSSCIYPKFSKQPITEDQLLTGSLEPSNECYAIAKIAGIKMCKAFNYQHGTNFISVMPTNLYGQNDNYDLETSHVLPAMIRKFHEAKKNKNSCVELWGSGTPLREFLYVDDLAEACIFLMNYKHKINEIVNIGTGIDISIYDLAYIIKDVVGYDGNIIFNNNGMDGTPKKLLDVSKINGMGWYSKTNLIDGIEKTYTFFKRKLSCMN